MTSLCLPKGLFGPEPVVQRDQAEFFQASDVWESPGAMVDFLQRRPSPVSEGMLEVISGFLEPTIGERSTPLLSVGEKEIDIEFTVFQPQDIAASDVLDSVRP